MTIDNPSTPDQDWDDEDQAVADEDGELGNPDDLTEDPGEDGDEDDNADAGVDGDDPGVAQPDDPFAPENL